MVKVATLNELSIVAELASNVWSSSKEELLEEFKATINNKESILFLKYSEDIPVGFAQCTLRHDYVEGTSSSPVGILKEYLSKKSTEKGDTQRNCFAHVNSGQKSRGAVSLQAIVN